MSWLFPGKNEKLTVRLARPADRPELAALLARTRRRHGIPAAEEQVALLGSGLSGIALSSSEAVGFLGLSPRTRAGEPSEQWVDLSLVAVGQDVSAAQTLRDLLRCVAPELRRQRVSGLVCLAADDWLVRGLIEAGFREIEQVVSYLRPHHGAAPGLPSLGDLRRAGAADGDTILRLNAEAFRPFWRYDDRTILGWLLASDRAVVAFEQGQPAGFALTTLGGGDDDLAHLVRVAIAPAWQGRGIGRRLVADAIRFTWDAGTPALALNTQASNTISRQLYESLGFHLTGGVLSVVVYAPIP